MDSQKVLPLKFPTNSSLPVIFSASSVGRYGNPFNNAFKLMFLSSWCELYSTLRMDMTLCLHMPVHTSFSTTSCLPPCVFSCEMKKCSDRPHLTWNMQRHHIHFQSGIKFSLHICVSQIAQYVLYVRHLYPCLILFLTNSHSSTTVTSVY